MPYIFSIAFRKIVVNSILATDMSLHDDYVQKINDQAKRIRENAIDTTDNAAVEREKIILCGALIKCADISNCVSFVEMMVDVYKHVHSIYIYTLG